MPFLVFRSGQPLGLASLRYESNRMRVLIPGARISIFRTRDEVARSIAATNATAELIRESLVADTPHGRAILSTEPFQVIECAQAFRAKQGNAVVVDIPERTQEEFPGFQPAERPATLNGCALFPT